MCKSFHIKEPSSCHILPFQVRIGIECCSVMPADVRCFNDLNNVALPYIPGSEFGGKVLEVGPNCVQKLKPGDNVAILSGK